MAISYIGVRNGGLSYNEDGDVSTTRVLVFHFNAGESSVDIMARSEIPKTGVAHPDNESIKLRSYSISEPLEGDGNLSGKYEVTLNYTRTRELQERDKTVVPWRRRPYNISIPTTAIIIPFQKAYQTGDRKGSPSKPVLNSAGDPFEDTKEDFRKVLKFSYNLKDFPSTFVDDYVNTINSAAVQIIDVGIKAKRGRLKSLFPSKIDEYASDGTLQYTFWQVDVEIEINTEDYKREIMQRGLFALKTANTLSSKYRIHIDDTGEIGARVDLDATKNPIPVDEPQRLNANGTIYTADLTGAVYAEFEDPFAADWNPLGFPRSMRT